MFFCGPACLCVANRDAPKNEKLRLMATTTKKPSEKPSPRAFSLVSPPQPYWRKIILYQVCIQYVLLETRQLRWKNHWLITTLLLSHISTLFATNALSFPTLF
jgi:hypothetical protein